MLVQSKREPNITLHNGPSNIKWNYELKTFWLQLSKVCKHRHIFSILASPGDVLSLHGKGVGKHRCYAASSRMPTVASLTVLWKCRWTKSWILTGLTVALKASSAPKRVFFWCWVILDNLDIIRKWGLGYFGWFGYYSRVM